MPEPTAVPAPASTSTVAKNVSTVAQQPQEQPPAKSEFSELAAQLSELNHHLSRKTSLRFLFAAALLQGLGYLLGATLVASIVVAIVVRFLGTLNLPAMLNDLIGEIELPSPTQQIDLRQYPF